MQIDSILLKIQNNFKYLDILYNTVSQQFDDNYTAKIFVNMHEM